MTLGLLRGTQSIQKTIVRKVYSQPEVEVRTLANGAVAYIHVTGMNEPASSQFDLALSAALTAGQHDVILDLRGNPGGYVADAVKIASEFIPSGVIAYQMDSKGKTTEVTAAIDKGWIIERMIGAGRGFPHRVHYLPSWRERRSGSGRDVTTTSPGVVPAGRRRAPPARAPPD